MSQDCFPESENDPARLPSTRQARPEAGLPETPNVKLLVKEALDAYYNPAPLEGPSPDDVGDPLLFRAAAQSLQSPHRAFFGNAALAAAPGFLVLLATYLPRLDIPAAGPFVVAAPVVLMAALLAVALVRSRGTGSISYRMGALAGGALAASIFAVYIINLDPSPVAIAPAQTQKEPGDRFVRSMGSADAKDSLVDLGYGGNAVPPRLVRVTGHYTPNHASGGQVMIHTNSESALKTWMPTSRFDEL